MSAEASAREGGSFCPACGQPGAPASAVGDLAHARCAAALDLDPPRFCTRCGRRLDVQVYPLSVSATCRRCDGVHPRERSEAGV